MKFRAWLRPIALVLVVLLASQGAWPRVAHAGPSSQVEESLISKDTSNFLKGIVGSDVYTFARDYNLISLYYTGAFSALTYLLGSAGKLLCWFGVDSFCPAPESKTDGDGDGPPLCQDSIGALMPDPERKSECCPPAPPCGPPSNPEELSHFSSDIANAQERASLEISQANQFLGLEAQVAPEDDGLAGGDSQAATAGGVATSAQAPKSGDGGKRGNSAGPVGRSVQRGGGGGTSGMGKGLEIFETTPSAGGSGGVNGATGEVGGSGEGQYASGGGAGAATAGNGLGYNRGSGSGDEGSGTSEQVEFGDAGAKGDVAVIGEDPEDYFTRIGLNDSLFKIIERRYGKKASGWVQDDLKRKP